MKTKRTDWYRLLVYGFATWLFSLGLSGLLAVGGELEFEVLSIGLFLLIYISVWLLILRFPWQSLGTLIFVGGIVGLALWDEPQLIQRFLASDFFWEIDSLMRAAVYYVGIRGFLVPPDYYFVLVFAIVSGLFGVLVLWRLGMPLLGFFALAAALYANALFTSDMPWMLWLLVGLSGVLIIASRRNLGQKLSNVKQRPLIVPIAIVLAVSFLLGSIVPSEWFFSDRLSRFVNDLEDPWENFRVEQRGLFTLGGGYNNTSSPINGLVNQTGTPYLMVIGPAESIYLRGSLFDEFDGKTWHGVRSSDARKLITPPSKDQLDAFDPYRYHALQYRRFGADWAEGIYQWLSEHYPQEPSESSFGPAIISDAYQEVHLIIEPIFTPQVIAYIPNVPYTIQSVGRFPDQESFGPIDEPEVFTFSGAGRVEREHSSSSQPYQVEGFAVPIGNSSGEANLWARQLQPKTHDSYGNPVTSRELNLRKYQEVVYQHDPPLADILYGEGEDLAKVILAKNHLAERYRYDLGVQAVPRDREFIDWFLETKVGYCVHYGTALALLLEDVGIPTRYVEGFVTGEASEVVGTNQYQRTVTTDQAHAWTEVYLEDLGWYPFDATPAGQRGQGTVIATPVMPVEEVHEVVETPIVEVEPTPVETAEEELVRPDRITEDEENANLPSVETEVIEEREPTTLPWNWILLTCSTLYLLWRQLVYKLRHNTSYLLKLYHKREDELVMRIFRDIQYLHVIGGYSIPKSWSSKQRFDDVLGKTSALDYHNADLAEQAIEEVYYAERMPTEEMLLGLMSYHRKLEQRVRHKIKWPEWFVRRFLWSPRHPL